MSDTQTYANHVRRMPPFVNVVGVLMLFVLLWTAYRLVTHFSMDALAAFIVAFILPSLAVVSRQQTLTVQNRVIRLEERLRYAAVLPADLAARASALPVDQLIALRFASDAELPALVAEVLAGQLTDPKAIKQRVKDWRADFLRA
ncbi:MAG: hypothetical protein JSU08_08060 [Acidobacteria bacterium]|nr:hypothetical protein [Acidobacteriota bacterium]